MSGLRCLIQKRLKISGAWWTKNNAEAMLSLRTIRANRLWEACWQQFTTNEARPSDYINQHFCSHPVLLRTISLSLCLRILRLFAKKKSSARSLDNHSSPGLKKATGSLVIKGTSSDLSRANSFRCSVTFTAESKPINDATSHHFSVSRSR